MALQARNPKTNATKLIKKRQTRVLGFETENPRIRLKSVNPLLPPNPVSFLKCQRLCNDR